MEKLGPKVGILTFPIEASGVIPLLNLISVLKNICSKLTVITGNEGYSSLKFDSNVKSYGFNHRESKNPIIRVLTYVLLQIRMSLLILKLHKEIDQWVFFIGGDTLLLPGICAKLVRKKVIISFAGSSELSYMAKKDSLANVLKILSKINRLIADAITVYSLKLVSEYGLNDNINKIFVAHEHTIDFKIFKSHSKPSERQNRIGFLGRLSKEKGILRLTEALIDYPIEGYDFYVAGEGILRDEVQKKMNEIKNDTKNAMIGWLDHNSVPTFLNSLKLLVVPSATEGLPNVIIESMACGTPVLAASIGAVSDLIKDESTGYLLKTNSPESWSKEISKIVLEGNLDKISENAMVFVREKFIMDAAVAGWKKVLKLEEST